MTHSAHSRLITPRKRATSDLRWPRTCHLLGDDAANLTTVHDVTLVD
jgi:hypothetical protein